MNPLFTAIFDRDVRQVRAVAEQHPELLSERFPTGELPVQFAGSHPLYLPILVYLIRHSAPGSERFTDWQGLLESYICHLSHTHACAGWLGGIEFILWCIVSGDPLPVEDNHGFADLSADTLDDLRFLSEKAQHWPYWDDVEGRVQMASLLRWEHIYEDWHTQRIAKQNNP